MNQGSNRRFGIVSELSGLQQGMIVNNISFTSNVQTAQARDKNGRIIDIAVYSESYQVTIDGLYIGQIIHAGSVITIDNKRFLVTQTGRVENNSAFQTASINARYAPDCYYWPLSTVTTGKSSGTIYSETGDQPTPPEPPQNPTISLATIPNISWDFENSTTSSINFGSYVTYNGSSNLTYTITETLPSGVTLNNGILFANKEQMTADVDTTLTLNVSASDVLSTATEQFGFVVSNVIEPVPEPTIEIATIPNISWDFENASTSAINFSSYVTYTGSSTLNYSISETLPSGVTFNNGILSADKSLMDTNVNTTLTLNVSASDVLSTATEQFGFVVSNAVQPQPDPNKVPLTFKGLNPVNTIQLSAFGNPDEIVLKAKINNGSWNTVQVDQNTYYTVILHEGDTVSFSGANNYFSKDFGDFYFFSMTGAIEASGNIQSLMSFSTSATPYCYFSLFNDCSSLKNSPDLSATTLAEGCYSSMFNGCSNLTSINVAFTDWTQATDATYNWVQNVAPTGIFYKPDALSAEYGVSRIPVGWTIGEEPIDPTTIPLTFKGLDNVNTVQLSAVGNPDEIVLKAKINDGNWNTVQVDQNTYYTVILHQGDTVSFSGANDHFSKDNYNYYRFAMTGSIEASGNVQSLLNFSNSCADSCYFGLFLRCTSLTKAPDLPATILCGGCYNNMFSTCSSLTTPPSLPATNLAPNCYYMMFANCSSLTATPSLPATTLANECYYGMFWKCSSLITAPQLPATELSYFNYQYMFYGCTNLSSVPILSATTLKPCCYYGMFAYCSSLSSVPSDMIRAEIQDEEACAWMFEMCTSLTSAPALPEDRYLSCYIGMFKGCTKLSNITVHFTSWKYSGELITTDWVSGVAANGTFYKPTSLSTTHGRSYIPSNWTVVNQ